MGETASCKSLPILLGIIRQEAGDGELVLEQNDGMRRLCFLKGELIYLKSEVVGEQFGSYLLRQGIVDLTMFNELLANDERYRIGEKVIQWGIMSVEERDDHLQCLQEQIMVHSLEHPILAWTWNAGSMDHHLSQDLHLKLQHRHFIWRTFQEFNDPGELLAILKSEADWKWEGRGNLLENLSDLPLTSSTAFALSFLTADPVGFETFCFLSNLSEAEAVRFIATLWALGALVLSSGKLPTVSAAPAPVRAQPTPIKPVPSLPLILPPPTTPFGPPKQRTLEPQIELDDFDASHQPEFLDLDHDPGGDLGQPMTLQALSEIDLPPCGPHPQSQPEPSLFADDLPPCGPRPQPRSRPTSFAEDLPPCGLHPQPRPETPPFPEDMPPCGPPPQPQAFSFPDDLPPCGPPPQPRPQLPSGRQAQSIELDPERKGVPDPPTPQALSDARKLCDRARHQAKLGRTLEAVYTLEQAIQVLPDGDAAYEAWLMLGRLRMANQAWYTRAIHALENAARIRAREAEPWTTMGELHHRAGSEQKALDCYRKALALDPSVVLPPGWEHKVTPRDHSPANTAKKGLFGGRGDKA